jgi:hypothetical protein
VRIRKRLLARILFVVVALSGAIGIAAYSAVGTFGVVIPESLKGIKPGDLVAVARIGKYPAFAARYILDTVRLPDPIEVTHGITLYRVSYRTTNYDGSVVVASGLVALPDGSDFRGLLVYHHGTNAERHTAPSQPGLGEGLLVAAAVAGAGNILVAPDYIGLGESHALHPYMHARTASSTSIDLLRAARALIEHWQVRWPASLYLLGFSQAGHATFAVQRDLEKLHDPRFEVRASAPIAGPFHLREVSFPQALSGKTKSHAFYLAYVANSYARIYGRPLKSILAAPYLEQVPVYFDGDHTTEEISAALPGDPRRLFNSQFLDAYDRGESHWFLDAIAENNVDAWAPVAPIRIYYGDDDVDVLPEEARRAAAEMKGRSADVTAISVGRCDHNASVLRAIPQALRWFGEISSQKRPR